MDVVKLQTKHTGIIQAALLLTPLLVCGTPPIPARAQPVASHDTLLLVEFDHTCDADFSRGASIGRSDVPLTEGRFGKGADLRGGGTVSYAGNDGNFNPDSGTIEFWIKPDWDGASEGTHRLFSCQFGEKGYININTLGKGRFGIAMSARAGDDWIWRRADVDISDWKAGQWHHVACVWGNGQIRIYADGRLGKTVRDAVMPDQMPEQLVFSGCNAVLDSVRISRRSFSDHDVQLAIQQATGPAPYRYVGDMIAPRDRTHIVRQRTRLGDIHIPLILDASRYSKAFGLRPGSEVSIPLQGDFETLQGVIGLDRFSSETESVSFQVIGDGKLLFESGPLTIHSKCPTLKVPVAGVKKLTLVCRSGSASAGQSIGAWANCVVARAGSDPVVPASRKTKASTLAMYERQIAADRFSFEMPVGMPFCVVSKYWEDEIDPSKPVDCNEVRLVAFAAPGEYEPINFTIYAAAELKRVSVDVSDLRSATARLASDQVDVRLVLRGLMRDIYSRPADRSTVVSRFLLPNQTVEIPAGTFREYHMIVHVPESAAAGTYRGTARIMQTGHPEVTLPIEFEVLPIHLHPLKEEAYGVYYSFPRAEDAWTGVDMELTDIREHGGTTLVAHAGVTFAEENGEMQPSVQRLHRCLELMRKHGFHGPLPVNTGLPSLAKRMHFDPIKDDVRSPAGKRFRQIAEKGLKQLTDLAGKYPEFELLATHMDEVFGRDRLARYIRLTEIVRECTSLRIYITLHNTPRPGVEEMMCQCDPFVDVRSYNGHAMDAWIRSGHTFQELDKQLNESGDEAWTYYNIRGSFFKPEWTRLVNGFYLWVSPLRVHAPWMYYSVSGNPLDDTDGSHHDFAYAAPDPKHPDRLISTRHWEAFREGMDDMRYLKTLEVLVAEHPQSPKGDAARKWLRQVRQSLAFANEELQRIEVESPILVLWSGRFNGAGYRRLRREAARHIQNLQQ